MFHQKLKNLRLKHGLSQQQLAKEFGITQQAYAKWENKVYSPSLATLEKVANFFNIPIAQLLDDKISLDYLLSAETFTYKDETLSDSQVAELKDKIRQIIGD